MEVKRQSKDGTLQSTKPNELATLNTKARIATTAQLLKNLNGDEKLQWALQTKEEGNQLFQKKDFAAAIEKYMETLSAADFGSSLNETLETNGRGNVDVLIIPILCNLAACCVELEQWQKVILFADQALKLRPTCRKAKYRQGIGYMNIGEFDKAIDVFEELSSESQQRWNSEVLHGNSLLESSNLHHDQNSSVSGAASSMHLKDKEIQKLPNLLKQAKIKKRQQQQVVAKQKEALKKAFLIPSFDSRSLSKEVNMSMNNESFESSDKDVNISRRNDIRPETTLEYIVVFIAVVVKYLYTLFMNNLIKYRKLGSSTSIDSNADH